MADTIAAIATGTQVSAIGIIRLSGDETFRVIDRLFFPYSDKKMSESADRCATAGASCWTCACAR